MKITEVVKGVEAKIRSDLLEDGNPPNAAEEWAGFSKGDTLVGKNSSDPVVSMMQAADMRDRYDLSFLSRLDWS